MKEFPDNGCLKFDENNKDVLETYLKEKRTTSSDLSGTIIGWNRNHYWFCGYSLKTEYKWEELSKFVTKIVSMENIDRNLLIECSSEADSKEVFDYLKSKGENINPNYYNFATKTCNTNWYFVGFNKNYKEWTVASKESPNFNYKKVVLSEDFLGKTPLEDYTGRTIKALIQNAQSTGVQVGEKIKILETKGCNYVLDKNAKGTPPGMRINKPLNLKEWELLPESIETSTVVDMKAIQEECKRRFPIGCTYDSSDKYARVLKQDYSTYSIQSNDVIYAHEGGGCLYKNGDYATLVSFSEEKTIKQNLIVGRWYKYKGWYIKYKKTNTGLFKSSEQITDNRKYSKTNGSFGEADYEKVLLEDLSEIQAYLPDGHPDKLSKPSIPEYVECIKSITNSFTVGKIYDWPYPIDDQKDRRAIPIQGSLYSFKPSTKEAYDAQFVTTSSILPKKWCVKITSSNKEVLNRWRKRQPNFSELGVGFKGWLVSDKRDGTYTHWDDCVPNGYTEITLQQFYDNVYHIDVYDIIKKESSVYGYDSYETIKTKPLIEDVQSVSVNLSTKKNNNKFKF